MINNWTVKAKQIKDSTKGLINHFNYLQCNRRASHYYTKITDLNKSNEKINNILEEYEQRKKNRKNKGLRGGGISNLATSFVLSIPRDIKQPTPKQWVKIANITIGELSKALDIDKKTLTSLIVLYLHDENKSSDKNTHCHMLISNIINGEHDKRITQKITTQTIKKGFNKAMYIVMNEDHKKYNPLNTNVKNKPLWVSRKEKEKEKEKNNPIDVEKQRSLDKLKLELELTNNRDILIKKENKNTIENKLRR